MRRLRVLWFVCALALGGCAWTSHALVAPDEYSLDSRLRHMDFCLFEATKAVRSGAGPLDEPARSPLKGRATQRFIDSGRPVLDQQGNPAPWRSPLRFYGSSDLSDRYVLCLLGLGYYWDD
ncbi:MAG: hypothetical protein HY208_04005 [Nitrospirae bacterium]|nr:hypothetical protein [Nitrospirota bacterium]